MENKKFLTLLIAVTALCALITLAHFAYAIYAYQHCSIIYFIGRELW